MNQKQKILIYFATLIFLVQINTNAQILTGSDSINVMWPNATYFDFSAQTGSNDSVGTNFWADFRGTANEGCNFGNENTQIPGRRILRYATSGDIDTVTNVPLWTNEAPWVFISWDWPNGTKGLPLKVGEIWVVYTREGHYAVMQITYVDSNSSGQVGFGDYFKFVYKYQPNGSNDLTGPVPVELSSFTVNVSENNIILNWVTASETNNMGFEVLRKVGSEEWNVVGFVNGNGTTTELNNYSFVDVLNSGSTGNIKYRLKQIDFDGKFEYSNIVEVEIGVPNEFSLSQNYPNPFNPVTVVSYLLPVESKVSLKVFDVLGNEVATLVNENQSAGSYSVSFDGSKLSSGIYYYTLRAADPSISSEHSFIQTKKMILIK